MPVDTLLLPPTAARLQPAAVALQVDGLDVRLGDRPIVQAVSFSLARGRTLALLGPSGCGKTTLLRAIAGLTPAAAGAIAIAGRSVGALPPQQRGVGMVFQHYALFPNLSVTDNLCFGPLAQGWTAQRAHARADTLLRLIDLEPHAHKRPAQLSGGQRQRVAMARALAPEPALLLMDEPFSAIDESFRLPLRRAFRALQHTLQQSCVIVTHDRAEALELADDVAVMLDGRLAHLGTPAELLSRPASRAVAQFLGAFNLFDALPAVVAAQLGGAPALAWAAPVNALRPAAENGAGVGAGAGSGEYWCFEATVSARHPGIHLAQLELRSDDGAWLQMLEPAGGLQPGTCLRRARALSALHPLAV